MKTLKQDTKFVTIRLSIELYNKLREQADKEERNISQLIRKAIKQYLLVD